MSAIQPRARRFRIVAVVSALAGMLSASCGSDTQSSGGTGRTTSVGGATSGGATSGGATSPGGATSGGATSGGASQPGCAAAPACGSCATCYEACVCETGHFTQCADACAGSAPVGMGGTTSTGGTSTGGTTSTGGGINDGGTAGATNTGGTTGGGGVTGGGVTGNGGTPSGGVTGGGGVAVGGSTGAGSITIVGSVSKCSDTPASPPNAQVSACSMNGCTNAHCLPGALVPVGQDISLLAKCPDGSICTPDDYIATTGRFLPKTCRSLLNAEGRCISKCVSLVNTQLTTLPKDVCADTELCAPCFNPITGTDTQACSQGCDTGPVNKTPVKFVECGGGLGVCVPLALLQDPVQQSALRAIDDPTAACTQKDASGAAYVCAPKLKANDQSANFPVCTPTSIGGLLALANAAGQKGGCIPKYMVLIAEQSLEAQDTCAPGELCATCTDPLSTPANAPSGACPWP